MDVRRAGCVIIFVILLCALATGRSECRKRADYFFFGRRIALASPEMDKDMAGQLWISFRRKLMYVKAVGDFDLHCPEETNCYPDEANLKAESLSNLKIQKAISSLPPHMRQTFLDCLKNKRLIFCVSRDESGSNNGYIKFLESAFVWPDAPRRYLGSRFPQHIAVTPAPAPVVEPPVFAPAPSSGPEPASTPDPNFPPSESPQIPSLPPDLFDSGVLPLPGAHSSASPEFSPHHSPKRHNNRESVVIAVIATTAGTFAIGAVLVFCCYKSCKNNAVFVDAKRDERPLLTLSLSDFSVGSSRNSSALENSVNKEKLHNQSISSGKIHNAGSDIQKFSLAEAPLPGAIAANSQAESHDGNKNVTVSPLSLKPPPGRADPNPHGPPSPLPIPSGPPPPPPPKIVSPPPRPPPPLPVGPRKTQPSPLGPKKPGSTASSESNDLNDDSEAPKAKLKPFFWDKVLAKPDDSMVWHQISAGSFQFNEETIATLFGYTPANKVINDRRKQSSQDSSNQYIQIIDSKKSQNLSILLRALNMTTEEVCDALQEGNELPTELLRTLLKMAPTTEEELKLRLFSGDLSQLGPAERFLKVLVDIPFCFKRMEALLFMSSLQEEVSVVKESLATLEVACKELKNSRLFLKLLEAVLKTGNRMNDGTFRGGAQAFKLDTLLKLADVKGTDGKTTLLHFVVQEIIRSEGMRAARAARQSGSISSVKSDDLAEDSSQESVEHYRILGLQVVSSLGDDLENVRKAAVLDADGLTGTVSKFGHSLVKTRNFLNSEMKSLDEDSGFHYILKSFVEQAEVDVTWLLAEEKRIMALVKSTADYFHGNAGRDEGLRLFVIVRDFLVILDKACKEVRESQKRPARTPRKEISSVPPSPDSRQPPPDLHRHLFPTIVDRRMDSSSSSESSDDESKSP